MTDPSREFEHLVLGMRDENYHCDRDRQSNISPLPSRVTPNENEELPYTINKVYI